MAKQPLYSVILARNCLLTGLSPENNSWSSGGGVASESRITFPPEQQMVEVSPLNYFALQKLQISVIELAPRDAWLLHSVVEKAIRVILLHFLFLVATVAVLFCRRRDCLCSTDSVARAAPVAVLFCRRRDCFCSSDSFSLLILLIVLFCWRFKPFETRARFSEA